MTVRGLDHVNIRVADPDATRAFLVDVLDMGVSPEVPAWITDAAGHPAIHVGGLNNPYPTDTWQPFAGDERGGCVHHVALDCTDYDAMLGRIAGRGIDHLARDAPGSGLRQIFVRAPGGMMLELNFRE